MGYKVVKTKIIYLDDYINLFPLIKVYISEKASMKGSIDYIAVEHNERFGFKSEQNIFWELTNTLSSSYQ